MPTEEKKSRVAKRSKTYAGKEVWRLNDEDTKKYVSEIEALNAAKNPVSESELTPEQIDILSKLRAIDSNVKPYIYTRPAGQSDEEADTMYVDIDGESVPIEDKQTFNDYITNNIRYTIENLSSNDKSNVNYALKENPFLSSLALEKHGPLVVNLKNFGLYDKYQEEKFVDGEKAVDIGYVMYGDKGALDNSLREHVKSFQEPVEVQQTKEIVHPNIKSVENIKLSEINTNVPNVAMPPVQKVQEEHVNVPLVTPQQQNIKAAVVTPPIEQQATPQPKIINNPAAQNAQLMEDQSPTQSAVVDDSVFAYQNNTPLPDVPKVNTNQVNQVQAPVQQSTVIVPQTTQQSINKTQTATSTPEVQTQQVSAPAQPPTTTHAAPAQQVAPPVQQATVQTTEPDPQWLGQVGAANTVNSALDFNPGANYINTPLADEHSLPLQILGNNQVHFLQKDKRTPQQTASIAKFLNKAYGTKIPEDGSRNSEMEITKVYNANLDTIPESLYRQGYIAGKPETKEEKTQKLLKEAVEKGRSFLDIYNIANEPPVYDRPRANRIDQNSKASVVADVLKLIGEGVTTKRGGTPITRQTIVPQLNAELQRLNDTYKQEVQAYKKGGFNALLMDEQEKKRSAAVEAAREAAIQQIKIKADIEQRQREKQEQSELNKIKTKHEFDMQRDKINNEAKVKTANISASGRKNSGSNTDEFKRVDKMVNGKIVKVPIAVVEHVGAQMRKIPINRNLADNDLFEEHWNKYFDYVNGEFVPKGTAQATTGATSRASSNNTQPKSRAK